MESNGNSSNGAASAAEMPSCHVKESNTNEEPIEPNILVMSDAGKLIFSRRQGNEEGIATICGVIHATRSSILYNESLGNENIQYLQMDGLQIVFMTETSLTIVAIATQDDTGSYRPEPYMRMLLEYVYGLIIFTLTDYVQNILQSNPNFDAQNFLGTADDTIRNMLYELGPFGSLGGSFLTSSIEMFPLIPLEVRDTSSIHLSCICQENEDVVFAMIFVGHRLFNIVQPHNTQYQCTSSDLILLVNSIHRQTSSTSDAELWVPICLPRFHKSTFLNAYHTYLDVENDVTLTLISQQNSSEQFHSLQIVATDIRKKFGFDSRQNSLLQFYNLGKDDDCKETEKISNSDDVAPAESGLSNLLWERVQLNEEQEGEDYDDYDGGDDTYQILTGDTRISRTYSYFVARSIKEALKPRYETFVMKKYLKIANALHFTFHCRESICHYKSNKDSKGTLSQCFTTPMTLVNSLGASRNIIMWNTYQRLRLKLLLGDSYVETTMSLYNTKNNDTDGHAASSSNTDQNSNSIRCPAQECLERSPQHKKNGPQQSSHSIEVDGNLFAGVCTNKYEIYATFLNDVEPQQAVDLCIKLASRLMEDGPKLFLSHPLSI